MKNWKHVIIAASLLTLLCSAFSVPCFSNYREYLVFGTIVDNNNKPVSKVTIFLVNEKKNRTFQCRTDKQGKFKYAGLPHGIYKVTMKKQGYKTITAEWDLNQKQNRMQKVDYHTIVMLSQQQHHDIELGKKLLKGYKKAKVLISKEDYDGAAAILQSMIKEKSNEAPLLYLLGSCHLALKKYDRAIPLFEKVVEIKPSFPGGHFQLGVCFQRTGVLDKALDSYHRTLALEPQNQTCLYNIGLILYSLNKSAEALPYFKKVLAMNGQDAEILEMIGLCHLRSENYDKALEYLEKAKINVKNQEKLKSLETLIEELKKTKEK